MGKVTKRRVIKISLAILAVVGILLGLLVVLTRGWGPETTFDFLTGRTTIEGIPQGPGTGATRTTRAFYSFEADFDDICAEAGAELSMLGFRPRVFHPPGPFIREYELHDPNSGKSTVVIIRGKCGIRLSTRVTPEGSFKRVGYSTRSGWVSVEITRRRPRLWPPRYLLYYLQRRLRRTANNPPVGR